MNRYPEKRLGELIEIKHGFAFEGQYFVDDGSYMLLTPGNFAEIGGFRDRGGKQKHYEGPVPSEFVLAPGDLLVAMTEQGEGLLGSTAFVPEGKPCLHNQRLGLIQPRYGAAVDLNFIYYLFNSRLVRAQIRASSSGTKVRHTSPIRIYAVLAPFPDVPTQRRIASILRAYDRMIEINRRRIALLGEMARRIFEDAVGSFREREEEGTSAATVVETTLGGDWGDERATSEEPCETRVIRGTDFRRIQSGDFSTAPTRFISERSIQRRLLRPFDLVVENSINAKTRNAGTPLLISAGTIEALGSSVIATSFCRLFRCTTPEHALVLFHFMDWMQRNNEMRQFQVVAANGIANFQSEHFMKRAVIPLSLDVIESLGRRLIPFAATTFQQQTSNLSRQREILLPRLVSGELSVSAAEQELEAVA